MLAVRCTTPGFPDCTISLQPFETVATIKHHIGNAFNIKIREVTLDGRTLENGTRVDELNLWPPYVLCVHPETTPKNNVYADAARPAGLTALSITRNIQRLMECGFDKENVERAMRAAQYNTDRAIDYLIGGYIPEPLVIKP